MRRWEPLTSPALRPELRPQNETPEKPMSQSERTTIDQGEVDRVSRQWRPKWWNPQGKFRPLHKFNPVRLTYIRDHVATHFGRDPRRQASGRPSRFLDIGCADGLLCEPMARMGADVLGADASRTNIEVGPRFMPTKRRPSFSYRGP